MDKFESLLNAIEHPENYTPDELERMASDPETSEIYRALCAARSSAFSGNMLEEDDVEKEWEKFSKTLSKRPKKWKFPAYLSSRRHIVACAVMGVVSVSMLAIGVSMSMKMNHADSPKIEKPSDVVKPILTTSELSDIYLDSTSVMKRDLVFENESLDVILDRLAPHYGVKVNYMTDAAKSIRLFYKWDSSISLDSLIGQLNTFERIRLHRDGDTLNVN